MDLQHLLVLVCLVGLVVGGRLADRVWHKHSPATRRRANLQATTPQDVCVLSNGGARKGHKTSRTQDPLVVHVRLDRQEPNRNIELTVAVLQLRTHRVTLEPRHIAVASRLVQCLVLLNELIRPVDPTVLVDHASRRQLGGNSSNVPARVQTQLSQRLVLHHALACQEHYAFLGVLLVAIPDRVRPGATCVSTPEQPRHQPRARVCVRTNVLRASLVVSGEVRHHPPDGIKRHRTPIRQVASASPPHLSTSLGLIQETQATTGCTGNVGGGSERILSLGGFRGHCVDPFSGVYIDHGLIIARNRCVCNLLCLFC